MCWGEVCVLLGLFILPEQISAIWAQGCGSALTLHSHVHRYILEHTHLLHVSFWSTHHRASISLLSCPLLLAALLPQSSGPEEADAMQLFLCMEASSKVNQAQDTARALQLSDEESWTCTQAMDIPQQHDGVNCGVFALVFAECICLGHSLRRCNLDAHTMDCARARLADMLLQVGNCIRATVACISVFAADLAVS